MQQVLVYSDSLTWGIIPATRKAAKFTGAAAKSAGLAEAYRSIAGELGCHFFDAGSMTSASKVDGVHLDADQHRTLGLALAAVVASHLGASPLVTPHAPPHVMPPAAS